MKFSLITPEHNPDNLPFLIELFESIKAQTYSNWEWILFLNNGCNASHIPDLIKNHSQVRVIVDEENNEKIGHIKNKAFFQGTGDILVEVDHDDILISTCLEELLKAFLDPTVGFVYSDNAVLHMTDTFQPYGSEHGWTYKTFEWGDKQLISMDSFEPTSHSLAYIWYAPDHVRAWRRQVYHDIEGHNKSLSVCDDHDLMIRTYLYTKMVRIPKVLYIYRITGTNTWLQRTEEIQKTTVSLFNHYGRLLAERDADLRRLLKVDIGGGINPYPGYKTVDIRDTADWVADLNEGIPLPDNSVGVLNASHILEHLYDKHKIMQEIHRVLAPGGWVFIEVPSTDGRGAFQDPTHVSYWNENCFLYYTDAYLGDFIDNKDIKFQQYRKETWFPNEWLKKLNVCVTTAWLVAVKPNMPRLPGELKI